MTDIGWISEDDDAKDLCAHGTIELEIDGERVGREDGEDLSVSAAALNLLRSLERDHTPSNPIATNLFPHCGFEWVEIEGRGLVNLSECPHGLDLEVRHRDGRVELLADSKKATVTEAEWSRHVCAFADRVEAFYLESLPRHAPEESFDWYLPFWDEWARRRAAAVTEEPGLA